MDLIKNSTTKFSDINNDYKDSPTLNQGDIVDKKS